MVGARQPMGRGAMVVALASVVAPISCGGGDANVAVTEGGSRVPEVTSSTIGAPTSTVARTIAADFFVSDSSFEGLPTTLTEELSLLPEVAEVSPVRMGQVRIDGDPKSVACVDWPTFSSLINVSPHEPSITELAPNEVLVHEDSAAELNLSVGDTVRVVGRDGRSGDWTVVGLFANDSLLSARWMVDLNAAPSACPTLDLFIAGSIADSVDEDGARVAVESVLDQYPDASVNWYSDFAGES